MTWGPIDRDWGAGWEDFDIDPFDASQAGPGDGEGTPRHRRMASVTRLPRRPFADRTASGVGVDESLTAPVGRRARRPASADTEPLRPRDPAPARPVGSRSAGIRPAGIRPDRQRTPHHARRSDPHAPNQRRLDRSHDRASTGRADVAGTPPRLRLVGGGGNGGGRPPRTGNGRNPRAIAVMVLLALLAAAVVGKLVHVQLFENERLVEAGQEQRERIRVLDATRGRILDRAGHDLALSVLRPSVFADPSQIDDPIATANRVAAALGPALGDTTVSELAADFARDTRFVYVARRIDDETASRLATADIDGVHLVEEPTRFTPSDDLARAVIGKVADDQTGSTGIELLYDDVLTGSPGEIRYERAPSGATIAAAEQSRVAPEPGHDVVLTLDRSLQYEAERVLSEQVDALGALGGMVVIAEPTTGDILALANITRNTDGHIITAGANRALIDVFEPGSVNKLITIAAALEEGLVEPHTSIEVPYSLPIYDHVFTDYDFHETRQMTVTEIMAKSSNIGTIKLGQRLGEERLDAYLRDFGFGSGTSLEYPNESRGLLADVDDWSGTDIGSISIGQSVAVTAIQMLQATNVIASGGVYIEPRLVAATIDADGNRIDAPVVESRRVVSEQTAAEVREMLAEVVSDGTGARAAVDGYRVGGKTGTARKPQANGTYLDAAGNYHYVAAFSGMVPAEDPALTMIVVIDEPSATIYGGAAAAPIFSDLAKFALNRFRIPPVAAPVG